MTELHQLARGRREYMNRGGFARIYPSADRNKFAALAEHVHKRIEDTHIKYSTGQLAAAMKAARDTEMPYQANSAGADSWASRDGPAIALQSALEAIAEGKAAETAELYHATEDATEGHGTTWELHNVAADLERLLVDMQDREQDPAERKA